MQSTQTDVKEYSYFAGNQWRKAADHQFFEVHEPYSGKLFARVAAGTRADGRTAVDAAAKAFPGWAETTPAEKARLFLKLPRSSSAAEARSLKCWRVKLDRPFRSRRSSRTWSQRRCSRSQAGCIYPRARFWKRMRLGPIRSACGVHWAWSPVSRHGTAPTSCPGGPSYRRWLPETPSWSSHLSSLRSPQE